MYTPGITQSEFTTPYYSYAQSRDIGPLRDSRRIRELISVCIFRQILRNLFGVKETNSCFHRAYKQKRLEARDIQYQEQQQQQQQQTAAAAADREHPSVVQVGKSTPAPSGVAAVTSLSSVVVRTVLGSLLCTGGLRVRTCSIKVQTATSTNELDTAAAALLQLSSPAAGVM